MDYAIVENGIVTNIVWLHPNNADEFPDAVAVGNVPVWIGDAYDGGVFYRDGKRVLTAEEMAIAAMQEAIAEAEAAEAAYNEGVQEA